MSMRELIDQFNAMNSARIFHQNDKKLILSMKKIELNLYCKNYHH